MISTGLCNEGNGRRRPRRIAALALACMVSLLVLPAGACSDIPAIAGGVIGSTIPPGTVSPSATVDRIATAGKTFAPGPAATSNSTAISDSTATPGPTVTSGSGATADPPATVNPSVGSAAAPGPAASCEYASVNVKSLNVRSSASAKAGAVVAVASGDVVRILESKTVSGAVWYNVVTSVGKEGWCQARYLCLQSGADVFAPSENALLDWPSDTIDFTQPLTFQGCMQDMHEIAAAYPGLARVETIGASVMGNPIEAIVLGNPQADTKIFVHAAIHGREYLPAWVALRQAEAMLKASSLGASYKDVKVSDMLSRIQIWIVPIANPDGVRLATEGLDAVPPTMPEIAEALKAMNRGSTDFRYWKANAHGVDLNANFETGWNTNPKRKRKPGRENYPGPSPLSEPESKALYDLTLREDFDFVLSYHSSGGMIYWSDPVRTDTQSVNRQIANRFRKLNKYSVIFLSRKKQYGGYRDWFVTTYSRPGFTIEHGVGAFAILSPKRFPTVWKENRFILLEAALVEATTGAPEGTPGITPENTPGATPEGTPETTPEITPESTPENSD
jgi:g-D-glutamyl-meso-diaminopimelate peptidase